jgi:DNA modification methylase
MNVLNLDCRMGLSMLPDNSVDAILTDPPYEIGFMGKAWDSTGIAYDVNMWREALRVLKPGGHILAFGAARTYHRLACAIEDAGAEVRDSIMWVYGSGFPKSQKVGDGWGTGLKPAHEPICVARKPLSEKTIAANMARHGVGGINVEACRVPIDPDADASQLRTMSVSQHHGRDGWGMNTSSANPVARVLGEEGRWPANLIHDGSDEVIAEFPQSSVTGSRSQVSKAAIVEGTAWLVNNHQSTEYTDSGSAARFFYCAKPSKSEKGAGNDHPTVKPVALGRYLAKLVCPPGGLILDMFAGSGSFGVAAQLEGFQYIGFDDDPVSCELANRRLAQA